jgi:hypothetical protein
MVGILWIPLEVIIIFVIVTMTSITIIITTILPLPPSTSVTQIMPTYEWFSERESFLETLIVAELLQKFFAFCETQMIITMFRRAHYRIFVIQTEPVHWKQTLLLLAIARR